MARVLVTGGCGFIGSHLVEHLAAAGENVTVFDASAPAKSVAGVGYVAGDIRDGAAVSAVVSRDTEVIYHLSAMVGVDNYLAVPVDVIDVNLLGTMHVLRAAQATGAKVVVASTSEVYGRNPDPPWREDSDRVLGSTAVDRWSYSSSKGLAEHLTFACIHQYGIRASIVRYFNVYGPRQRPAYVVSRSIHRALRGVPPEVYDGGAQTRCFTYVDDAVNGTVLAATSPDADGECFNIGSHTENTVAEVVQLVCELTGLDTPVAALDTIASFGNCYQDIPRRVPDTSKARDMLGWQCTTPLRTGLAKTIEWARGDAAWLGRPAGEAPSWATTTS